MSEPCKWAGRDNPRILPNRHGGECRGDGCAGCLACTQPHCRVCGHTHAEGACAECVGSTRADLHEIARLCDALPEEVEHRGINGEAMVLLGPVSDPEARGHLEASVACGRVPADYLADNMGDDHPVFVLLSWQMVWRDALEHDEAPDHELSTAVDYIDRTLTYMAGYPHAPFEDFARDVRRCVAHLEAVLHDGEQHDRGAPCMSCGVPLERVWGKDDKQDGWNCPRCKQSSTEDQYRFAVAHLHREEATHLTDRDMEIRTGVKAGTVRVWAKRGQVQRRTDSGRTLYAVEDVERQMRGESKAV